MCRETKVTSFFLLQSCFEFMTGLGDKRKYKEHWKGWGRKIEKVRYRLQKFFLSNSVITKEKMKNFKFLIKMCITIEGKTDKFLNFTIKKFHHLVGEIKI